MPDSTVYEVEVSTQQRGLMNTRQRTKRGDGRGSVECLDRMLCFSERKKKRGQ